MHPSIIATITTKNGGSEKQHVIKIETNTININTSLNSNFLATQHIVLLSLLEEIET